MGERAAPRSPPHPFCFRVRDEMIVNMIAPSCKILSAPIIKHFIMRPVTDKPSKLPPCYPEWNSWITFPRPPEATAIHKYGASHLVLRGCFIINTHLLSPSPFFFALEYFCFIVFLVTLVHPCSLKPLSSSIYDKKTPLFLFKNTAASLLGARQAAHSQLMDIT